MPTKSESRAPAAAAAPSSSIVVDRAPAPAAGAGADLVAVAPAPTPAEGAASAAVEEDAPTLPLPLPLPPAPASPSVALVAVTPLGAVADDLALAEAASAATLVVAPSQQRGDALKLRLRGGVPGRGGAGDGRRDVAAASVPASHHHNTSKKRARAEARAAAYRAGEAASEADILSHLSDLASARAAEDDEAERAAHLQAAAAALHASRRRKAAENLNAVVVGALSGATLRGEAEGARARVRAQQAARAAAYRAAQEADEADALAHLAALAADAAAEEVAAHVKAYIHDQEAEESAILSHLAALADETARGGGDLAGPAEEESPSRLALDRDLDAHVVTELLSASAAASAAAAVVAAAAPETALPSPSPSSSSSSSSSAFHVPVQSYWVGDSIPIAYLTRPGSSTSSRAASPDSVSRELAGNDADQSRLRPIADALEDAAEGTRGRQRLRIRGAKPALNARTAAAGAPFELSDKGMPSPSAAVPARLLEPTASWVKGFEARRAEDAARATAAAAAAVAAVRSPPFVTTASPAPRNLVPAAAAAASATARRGRATPGGAATDARRTRASSLPAAPPAADYSHVKARVFEPPGAATPSAATLAAVAAAAPPPPPSEYIRGRGHTRGWVDVTDRSIVAQLPESRAASAAPRRASAAVPSRHTTTTTTTTTAPSAPTAASSAEAPAASAAASAAVTSPAARPARARSASVGVSPASLLASPATLRAAHPIRRSAKMAELEDLREIARAAAEGLIVGSKRGSLSAAEAARSADRLYHRAEEERARKAARSRERPANCTFVPAVTAKAHTIGLRTSYVPPDFVEATRRGGAPDSSGPHPQSPAAFGSGGGGGAASPGSPASDAAGRPASARSPGAAAHPAVPSRHEALYASAAYLAAKQEARARAAAENDPNLSFAPAITARARGMSSERRMDRLARSLPPGSRLDVSLVASASGGPTGAPPTASAAAASTAAASSSSERLFAYSRVFEERRVAAADAYYASILPLKPALNRRSLAMAEAPTSASALTRRPVYEPSPDTTAEALAARKREQELVGCTFAPTTLGVGGGAGSLRRASRARSASVGVGARRPSAAAAAPLALDEPVHERLTRLGQDTLAKLAAARKAADARELAQAPFTPAINRPAARDRRASMSSASAPGKGKGAAAAGARPGARVTAGALGSPTAGSATAAAGKTDVASRLLEDARIVAKRLEAKRAELARMQSVTYPFVPHLSDASRKLADANPARRARLVAAGHVAAASSTLAPAAPTVRAAGAAAAAAAATVPSSSAAPPSPSPQPGPAPFPSADRHLWDRLIDAARDFEHARARAVQTAVRQELERLTTPKAAGAASPASPVSRSEGARRVLRLLTDSAPTTVGARQGTGGGVLSSPSRSAARALALAVWSALCDEALGEDEQRGLVAELEARVAIRDTAFQPRPLARHADTLRAVYASAAVGLGPDGTWHGGGGSGDSPSSAGAAGGEPGTIWDALARQRKDVALLDEIKRRLELAQCTFTPNEGRYTFAKADDGEVPSAGAIAHAAAVQRSGLASPARASPARDAVARQRQKVAAFVAPNRSLNTSDVWEVVVSGVTAEATAAAKAAAEAARLLPPPTREAAVGDARLDDDQDASTPPAAAAAAAADPRPSPTKPPQSAPAAVAAPVAAQQATSSFVTVVPTPLATPTRPSVFSSPSLLRFVPHDDDDDHEDDADSVRGQAVVAAPAPAVAESDPRPSVEVPLSAPAPAPEQIAAPATMPAPSPAARPSALSSPPIARFAPDDEDDDDGGAGEEEAREAEGVDRTAVVAPTVDDEDEDEMGGWKHMPDPSPPRNMSMSHRGPG